MSAATVGAHATRAACRALGIEKSFGQTPVLRGVDLEIAEGSFAVLVGPSGCGKSTLLRLVAGLEEADKGSIELASRDVTHLPPRDRDVAMVFQSYALYPHLRVRDNLAFGLRLRGTKESEVEQRIREASGILGLDALLDRFPKQLSGGQRQRVAMGRAIVRRPNIFLFDEPLSNLDAALRINTRVELAKLHKLLEATMIYVTHDQVEAMTLADVIVVMSRGRIEQVGKPLDLYYRPANRFVAGFIGSPAMNFLPAEVTAAGAGGATVAVADGGKLGLVTTRPLATGEHITVGVRPEHLTAGAGGALTLTGTLEHVERLGETGYAHIALLEGRMLVAEIRGEVPASPDARITVSAAPEHIHVFDADGRRIELTSAPSRT